ncbi:hypothetical protein DICSQDRAFT_69627 [Dichomitus squalens LYAD-421 SS1]|uniref:CFA20 domain-containing protein n=1 Tax=Dichomitus squalens (strain LYAD-421) TaxID=732165 RepID=R7SNP8_DICSQ|nr:uncharacterized protein DICSQDRAFT_69627 [Dichomitus squalens LYAD-421 SS1]EJF57355.1 hypothetical protein DICSQDRAFT_69627 [Dichomitus squalens LYAD-421 SS1]
MFSSSVQPSLVSLFSSTGSDPLGLFQTHTDSTLPADSVICLLNDTTSQPVPPPPQTLITATGLEDDTAQSPNYTLDQTVLHLQSPTLRTTYIRCPPAAPAAPGKAGSRAYLGLKHAWMHLQVRNMGREWAFEVGVVDRSGREGVVRCSTFQKQPKLKLGVLPLLLLPLSFPPSSSRPLTSWSTTSLNLPSLLPHFSSGALARADEDDEEPSPFSPANNHNGGRTQVPSGTLSHVSYVKVYATCRLRRIWFNEGGPQQRLPWEFQLYAADNA